MQTIQQVLAQNPGLKPYIVSLHEEAGDKFTIHFECFADDDEHAAEQALDAYPTGVIVNVSRIAVH